MRPITMGSKGGGRVEIRRVVDRNPQNRLWYGFPVASYKRSLRPNRLLVHKTSRVVSANIVLKFLLIVNNRTERDDLCCRNRFGFKRSGFYRESAIELLPEYRLNAVSLKLVMSEFRIFDPGKRRGRTGFGSLRETTSAKSRTGKSP